MTHLKTTPVILTVFIFFCGFAYAADKQNNFSSDDPSMIGCALALQGQGASGRLDAVAGPTAAVH